MSGLPSQKDNPRFALSPHAQSALDCTTCHTIHAEKSYPRLLKSDVGTMCSTCHEDVYARFRLNERHRLLEGVMSCVSCHNPHEPSERGRLGGFKQQMCLECHRDKGGPFFYEHQASLIEGCTICHEVHGSPNRYLLVQQSVADLCSSCHAAEPAGHASFTSPGTDCVTCHTAIHGSNLDRTLLK
jgi:DmsE family decaheme c-type cytochrome